MTENEALCLLLDSSMRLNPTCSHEINQHNIKVLEAVGILTQAVMKANLKTKEE